MNDSKRLWGFPGLLLILPLTGCSLGSGPGEAETPGMHRQFARTMDIQTGVVLGDLDRAKAAAAWIATHEGEGEFPPETDVYRDEIQVYAARIAEAEDLDSVARQTGRIAAACGRCHQATDGGTQFVVGSDPPEGSAEAQQMILHLWAIDRMWEGLVGPSEEAWLAGARALDSNWDAEGGIFLTAGQTGRDRSTGAPLDRLTKEALSATTPEARAEAYGKLLATCNACHQPSDSLIKH